MLRQVLADMLVEEDLITVTYKKSSNTSAPVISPSAAVADTVLTASAGTWSRRPSAYTYQWYKGAVAIAGATTNEYTVVAGDVGAALTCQVAAVNLGGTADAIASAAVTPA